jgi:hypothetical protein
LCVNLKVNQEPDERGDHGLDFGTVVVCENLPRTLRSPRCRWSSAKVLRARQLELVGVWGDAGDTFEAQLGANTLWACAKFITQPVY